MIPGALLCAFLICERAIAADLHPIVEVHSGYLFGATSNGKWMEAEEAVKALSGGTTYQVYGLTEPLGESKGGKPKPSEEDVCSGVLTVSLSPKPEKGVIALAAPWNALPRKPRIADRTQQVYVDAVRDFLKTKGIEQPKVKIDNILRVDDACPNWREHLRATSYDDGWASLVACRLQVISKIGIDAYAVHLWGRF